MVFKDPTFLPYYGFVCTVLADNVIENFVLIGVLEKKSLAPGARLGRPWHNHDINKWTINKWNIKWPSLVAMSQV